MSNKITIFATALVKELKGVIIPGVREDKIIHQFTAQHLTPRVKDLTAFFFFSFGYWAWVKTSDLSSLRCFQKYTDEKHGFARKEGGDRDCAHTSSADMAHLPPGKGWRDVCLGEDHVQLQMDIWVHFSEYVESHSMLRLIIDFGTEGKTA